MVIGLELNPLLTKNWEDLLTQPNPLSSSHKLGKLPAGEFSDNGHLLNVNFNCYGTVWLHLVKSNKRVVSFFPGSTEKVRLIRLTNTTQKKQ